MARTKTQQVKPGKDAHLSVNVDGAVIRALDKEAERMTAEHPVLTFTRTDALRVVLHDWMMSRTRKGRA